MKLATQIAVLVAAALIVLTSLVLLLRPNYELIIAPTGQEYRIETTSGRVWKLLPSGKWLEVAPFGII